MKIKRNYAPAIACVGRSGYARFLPRQTIRGSVADSTRSRCSFSEPRKFDRPVSNRESKAVNASRSRAFCLAYSFAATVHVERVINYSSLLVPSRTRLARRRRRRTSEDQFIHNFDHFGNLLDGHASQGAGVDASNVSVRRRSSYNCSPALSERRQ